jgi:hypothetical protein
MYKERKKERKKKERFIIFSFLFYPMQLFQAKDRSRAQSIAQMSMDSDGELLFLSAS